MIHLIFQEVLDPNTGRPGSKICFFLFCLVLFFFYEQFKEYLG